MGKEKKKKYVHLKTIRYILQAKRNTSQVADQSCTHYFFITTVTY